MIKTLTTTAALSLAVIGSQAAADTEVFEGGSYDILSDDLFFGTVETAPGGADDYSVTFFTDEDPVNADASASLTVRIANTFTNLIVAWEDLAGNVLNSATVGAGITTLSTVFTAPNQAQNLVFSYDSSTGADFDFDVAAAPIPVPAAGFLLAGALGGLAFLRRRKTA